MNNIATNTRPDVKHDGNRWQLREERWLTLYDVTHALIGAFSNVQLQLQVIQALCHLQATELYFAFPGTVRLQALIDLYMTGDYQGLKQQVREITDVLTGQNLCGAEMDIAGEFAWTRRPRFEVLLVEQLAISPSRELVGRLGLQRRDEDPVVYEAVSVRSGHDSKLAILANSLIQVCLVESNSTPANKVLDDAPLTPSVGTLSFDTDAEELIRAIKEIRPEIGVFNVRFDNEKELHEKILLHIASRYDTPFFNALKTAASTPGESFHALPIARGRSVIGSQWMRDMVDFYGSGMLMAESSASSEPLDSLLDPIGPIKKAQQLAARAFGAQKSYFVTNGTSTANKIVVQALVQPGDIVLLDRNCHKSHHYAMVLSGADVVYLDAYPLTEYMMYGAVSLLTIKNALLRLRKAGLIERVKMLLLTNCTFDGIVYDAQRVMEECLAIKPDLVFLWDEAWFAFGRFHPLYRRRTGMAAAAAIGAMTSSPAYRERFAQFKTTFDSSSDQQWLEQRLLPDPDALCIRVYVTQSTHKTLTAMRQASMIHVFDECFGDVENAFREAYMTHTSTSPNYQLIASLDIARRQAELEGYHLVQRKISLGNALREKLAQHPFLASQLRFLSTNDLIPDAFRASANDKRTEIQGAVSMDERWHTDEFVLDQTRLTLYLGNISVEGHVFQRELMKKYGIQINKTSRNTALFMTSIGTSQRAVAYLLDSLEKFVAELHATDAPRRSLLNIVSPRLPDFSHFHPRFRQGGAEEGGDLRAAYFLANKTGAVRILALQEIRQAMQDGAELVSAMFVIPYPPGSPILVPGQILTAEIVSFIEGLKEIEIHGYRPEEGLRIFCAKALDYEQNLLPRTRHFNRLPLRVAI